MFEVRVKLSDASYCQFTEFSEWNEAVEFARLAGGCFGVDDVSIYDDSGYMIEFYDFEADVLVPTCLYI